MIDLIVDCLADAVAMIFRPKVLLCLGVAAIVIAMFL